MGIIKLMIMPIFIRVFIFKWNWVTPSSGSLILYKCPLQHFFPAWFFTIHQDAGSVNLTSDPSEEQKATHQQ